MESYQRHYKDRVVLITGGAGAIGSNLTRAIAGLDARAVFVLDDMSAAYEWNFPQAPNTTLIKGSVTDEVALDRVFREKPTIVFHLAAFFANQNSVDHPEQDLNVNGLGTLRVFQRSKDAGVERVVYASSGCSIYGSEAPLPLKEEFMSLRLTTPYQITKMLGELYGNFFHHHYQLGVVKTRFFNSYGPGEIPGAYRNVIPNMIFRALKGEALKLTCSEEASRDFTYVEDIVDGLLRAGYVDTAIGEEMNLASAVETRIHDLARRINELTGNDAGTVSAPKRVWDTKSRLLADITRAGNLLGYAPRIRFEDGLQKTVDWFRANWDDIQRDAEF